MKNAPNRLRREDTNDGAKGYGGSDDGYIDISVLIGKIVDIGEQFFKGGDVSDLVAIEEGAERGVDSNKVDELLVFDWEHD